MAQLATEAGAEKASNAMAHDIAEWAIRCHEATGQTKVISVAS